MLDQNAAFSQHVLCQLCQLVNCMLFRLFLNMCFYCCVMFYLRCVFSSLVCRHIRNSRALATAAPARCKCEHARISRLKRTPKSCVVMPNGAVWPPLLACAIPLSPEQCYVKQQFVDTSGRNHLANRPTHPPRP